MPGMTSGLDHREPAADAPGLFPVTRWSRVVRARATEDEATRRAALDELCAAYAPWLALEVADREDGWILMTAARPLA